MVAAEEKINQLIPLSKAMEELSLKSSAFYERMKFLRITPEKKNKKAYLLPEQIEILKQLGKHIEKHGAMEGFKPNQSALIKKDESNGLSANTVTEEFQAQNQNRNFGNEQQQMAQLIASAQNKAAGILIAEGALAQQFIANPELLPEGLRSQIEQANAIPQVDPNALAAELLQGYQAAANQ